MDNVLKLNAVAESSAGGDHRILEWNASHTYAQIGSGMHVGGGVECGRHGWLTPAELAACSGFPRCCVAKASVKTRPTACVGALMPSSDASVAARSTGS